MLLSAYCLVVERVMVPSKCSLCKEEAKKRGWSTKTHTIFRAHFFQKNVPVTAVNTLYGQFSTKRKCKHGSVECQYF